MNFADNLAKPDPTSVTQPLRMTGPTERVSQAIALLRFPLVVLVLYLHALPMMAPYAGDDGILYRLSQLIGQQLARLAVPLFFICAGYLLFLHYQYSRVFYRRLLVKKTHSLFIPFLLWSSLGIGLYAIGLSLPLTQSFYANQQKLADFWTLSGFVQSLFGFERSPLVYPLWFVRDLLIFVLLSPLWWLVLKTLGWWLLLPLSLLWLFDSWWLFQPALSATVFFAMGALCALKPCSGQYLQISGPWLAVAYLVFLVWQWWLPVPELMQKLMLLISLAALWFCALRITEWPRLREILTFSSGGVFFIFASHEPLLTITRKIVSQFLPASVTMQGLLYLLLPLALTCLLYQSYRLLLACAPGCCRILCGGR